ncbi:MAG TPA: hypothetical protein DCY13_09885 [Verrucomicrobiales bacterium]|nr:hypothetical protein [Verrucomicrobiales bacterium]
MQKTLVLSLAGVALTPVAVPALGIRVFDQDPAAIARGNAFVATADNPSAIYYNPAAITALPGQQALTGGNLVSLTDTYRSAAGMKFETEDQLHVLPQLYYTYSPSQLPLSFGLGVYTPFGLGFEWPDQVPFRQLSIEGRMTYLTANPVVAWKITDRLSIGGGVMVNYGDTTLTQGLTPAGFGPPGNRLRFEGDGFGVGFNAGIHWRVNDQHALGVAYRSQNRIDFSGTSDVNFPAAFSQDASAEFQFPDIVTVGYSFRPTPRWNLEVNVDWTNWDQLNTVTFEQSVTGNVARPFNWRSSFIYMVGASYLFDGNWTVSGGYIFSENSIPDESFNPGIPDSDRHVFSVGVNKRFDRITLGAAFQYGYGPERTINRPPGPGAPANGRYEFESFALSLSGGYRF